MTDTTRETVERLAKHHAADAERFAKGMPGRDFRLDTADTLLALLARAEAAERDAAQMSATQCAAPIYGGHGHMLCGQVATAVQAEREACAALIKTVAAEQDAKRDEAWGKTPPGQQPFYFGPMGGWLRHAADRLLARGPSDALADALRQAEARGMKQAAEVVLSETKMAQAHGLANGVRIAAAIIAAAEAKEKNDGE